jgi:hypothetical protein
MRHSQIESRGIATAGEVIGEGEAQSSRAGLLPDSASA